MNKFIMSFFLLLCPILLSADINIRSLNDHTYNVFETEIYIHSPFCKCVKKLNVDKKILRKYEESIIDFEICKKFDLYMYWYHLGRMVTYEEIIFNSNYK